MAFDLTLIYQASEKMLQQKRAGEIVEACCMAAMNTAVTESWEVAGELAEKARLSDEQQQTLLQALSPVVQKQLLSTGFDDFDLIYERLLQLVLIKTE